jgi:hypothetical protein
MSSSFRRFVLCNPLGPLAALALTSPALAATRPVVLRFQGPDPVAGCPGEAELRERVSSLTLGAAFVEAGGPEARVAVTQTPQGLAAGVVVLEGGAPVGDRHLETVAGDCPALMASVALSLVLFIDPVRGSEIARVPQAPITPRPAPPPSAPPPASAPPPPTAPPAEAPTPEPPHTPWVLSLVAGPLVSAGQGPEVVGALDAGLRAEHGSFAAGLALRPQWPADTPRDGGTIASNGLAAVPAVCLFFDPVELCGLARVGALWAEGQGFAQTASQRLNLLDVGARAAWMIRVSRTLSVRAQAELTTPLAHNTVVINGEDAWATPDVGGTFALELCWDFFTNSAAGARSR